MCEKTFANEFNCQKNFFKLGQSLNYLGKHIVKGVVELEALWKLKLKNIAMKPFLTIRDVAFTFAPPKINWRFHSPFKARTPSFNKKCVTPFFKCRTPNFKCATPSLKRVTPISGTVSVRRLVNSLKWRYLGVLFKGITSSGIFCCFHPIKTNFCADLFL